MAFPPYKSDHLAEDDVTVIKFTSRAEMERLISYRGVTLHLDDLDDDDDDFDLETNSDATDANAVIEIIQRVTSKMMEYLAPRFEAKDLFEIPRIREIATYWACHDLTRRRGNEPLFEDEVVEGEDTLERYREGTLYLQAPTSRPRVYVQNYIIDNRFSRSPVRVLNSGSTSTVNQQRLAWEYPFFWL